MANTAKTKTISLQHPFEHGGIKISTLVMRRPLVRDLRGAHRAAGPDGTRADFEVHLFAHLTEQLPEAIDQMDMADYEQMQDAYRDFTSRASTSAARGS